MQVPLYLIFRDDYDKATEKMINYKDDTYFK